MKIVSMSLAISTLITAANAFALEPAAGLWYNQNESGRGFTIDYQNGTMVVTAYVYNQDRTPTFLQASNSFDTRGNVFSGTLVASTGGQCFGCSYTSPSRSAFGDINITFTSPETANVSFPGGSTTITHVGYGYSGNQQDYLQGEWAFEYNVGGVVASQWIIFNTTYTASDGTLYQAGVLDGVAGTAAVGRVTEGHMIVAVAKSDGFTYAYDMFQFDDKHMFGYGDIFTTGSTLSEPTNSGIANRILTPAQLSTISLTNAKTSPIAEQQALERAAQFLNNVRTHRAD